MNNGIFSSLGSTGDFSAGAGAAVSAGAVSETVWLTVVSEAVVSEVELSSVVASSVRPSASLGFVAFSDSSFSVLGCSVSFPISSM